MEGAAEGATDAVVTGLDGEACVVGACDVELVVGVPVVGVLTPAVGAAAEAVAAGELGPVALGEELHPASASAQTAPVATTNRARTTCCLLLRRSTPASPAIASLTDGVPERGRGPGPSPRGRLAAQRVRMAVSSTTKSVGRELFSVPEIEIVTFLPANDPTLNERSW